MMSNVDRRNFLTLAAGTASVAVALKGSNAAAAAADQKIHTQDSFDVENQIDPWIELDLDALSSNVKEVRRRVGEIPIMAIVKCNAYGHGMIEIATALQKDNNIDRFAVVKTKEALDLRQNGINGMILNMGPFNRAEAQKIIDQDISQSVFSDAVTILNEEADRKNTVVKVHICIDTGLGRVGVPYRDASSFIEKVAKLEHIQIEGLFTAMTEDDDMDPVQVDRLNRIYDEASKKGIDLGIRHCASSAEVDRYPYTYMDMVRPGNCLVGLEPERQINMNIKQVMTFKTRIMFIKDMLPGDSIGYHQYYKIDKPTKIATLPLGYSDGYPPTMANKADVLIKGKRYPVVGLITANHTMIDITGSGDINIGEEVVLWGRQGDEEISKVELENHDSNATNAYRMSVRTRTYLPRITT